LIELLRYPFDDHQVSEEEVARLGNSVTVLGGPSDERPSYNRLVDGDYKAAQERDPKHLAEAEFCTTSESEVEATCEPVSHSQVLNQLRSED
jgi:hypothetical protein